MRSLLLLTALVLSGCISESPARAADSCGAAALQSFVGKPKEKLPVNLPQGTRLLCSTCPATMDFSPGRLNVIYDTETGIISKIRCG